MSAFCAGGAGGPVGLVVDLLFGQHSRRRKSDADDHRIEGYEDCLDDRGSVHALTGGDKRGKL